MNEYVRQIQVGIMFDRELDEIEKFAKKLNNDLDNLFDGMPSRMSSGGANEIVIGNRTPPKYQVSSKNQRIRCNLSEERFDLFLTPKEGENFKDIKKEHEEILEKYISKIFELDVPKVERVGFVYQSLLEEEEPVEKIKKELLNPNIDDLIETTVRINKRDSLGDKSLNNITEVGTGTEEIKEEKIEGIKLHRDINIRPEEYDDYLNEESTRDLLEYCWMEIKNESFRG